MTRPHVACPSCGHMARQRVDGTLTEHGSGDTYCDGSTYCGSDAETWDNKDAPAGATNTLRGLTHSSGTSREGLA